MNNELIIQRLSCIPIYIDDTSFPYEDYIVEINVSNDTENIKYITTKDFLNKNIKNDSYFMMLKEIKYFQIQLQVIILILLD